MAKHVDDMAFIHSCCTETNNHSPALFEINTGMSRMGFPCVGSWVTYGLGTENQNLPAFVVMYDTLGRGLPKGHAQNWGAGFLPGIYQGTALNAAGRADRQPRPPGGMSDRRAAPPARPAAAGSTSTHQQEHAAEAELAARIETLRAGLPHADGRPRSARRRARSRRRSQKLYGLDNPQVHALRQASA